MKSISKAILGVLFFVTFNTFGEGTKEVMPTTSNGTALHIGPQWQTGPYRGAPGDNRIYFTIKDHNTENLYFGVRGRRRNGGFGTVTNDYYRIVTEGGTQVVSPASLPESGNGFISTYTEAVNGPDYSGYTAGYSPITFNPTNNGTYYIELYRSSDAGSTAITTSDGEVYYIYFDFTIATSSGTKYPGRVFSKNWSFITYNPSSTDYEPSINYSFEGDFYGYTADSSVNKVEFASGFRPLGFNLQMNFEGVESSGDFEVDRKSQHVGSIAPVLTNPYRVFLNTPDTSIFKIAEAANQPVITGNIYGCEGEYLIPYYIDKSGDIVILLDVNGTSGFQSGTSDRVLQKFNVSAGNNVMEWDGLDGLGATVASGVTISILADIYRGRTNVPMNDAELNINGLTISSVFPATGSRPLYWDDASLTVNGSCGDANTDNTSSIGIAVTNFYSGINGPTHAWDGTASTAVPATTGGEGSATSTTCDDFGNVRVINTWFYADNVASSLVSKTVPTCSTGGGLTYKTDLDDDNDGISDLVESGGVDPHADADNDGISNYLDPSYPSFVDSNHDGVNDNFDKDLDGIINSLDLDSDNDAILDLLEAGGTDSNNDGTIDSQVDVNNNGIHDGYDIACDGTDLSGTGGTSAGTAGTVNNPSRAYDTDNANYAVLASSSAVLDVKLNQVMPLGSTVTIRARRGSSDANLRYSSSSDDATYSNEVEITTNNAVTDYTYNLTNRSEYIRFRRGTSNDNNVRIYHITYSGDVCNNTIGTAIANTDSDSDGLPNALDNDSDNDGCPDAIEGSASYNYSHLNSSDRLTATVNSSGIPGGTGQASGSSTNGSVQSTECSSCTSTHPDYVDSDGDAVGNDCDSDDDNDGILDTQEGVTSTTHAISGGDGGSTTSWNQTDLESVYFDFATVDNSVAITINGSGLNANNTLQLEGTAVAGEVKIVAASDGSELSQYWTANSNGLPRLRVIISKAGEVELWGTRNTSSTSLERLKTENGSSFNTVNFIAGSNSISVVNQDGDGPDGISGTAYITLATDTDADGIPNYLDIDSDNDGIADIVEAGGVDTNGDGRIDSSTDADGDGLKDVYDTSAGGDAISDADNDGDGVKNRLDLDSDNDGLPDVIEAFGTDANNDGKIDSFTDTDGDGFSQNVDGDNNNDGTAESTAAALIITGTDTDSDGVPNSWPRANNDGNGYPNGYDLDADGDGILDTREAGITDSDNNGIADGTLGADGWSDTVDALLSLNPTNSDSHGSANYLDIDADNDGIVDNIEGQTTAGYIAPSGSDSDGDGIDNTYDNNNAAFAGSSSNGIAPTNTDGADVVDYMDSDSDNDGNTDRLEGWDTDGNGIVEGAEIAYVGTTDSDNDGLFDEYDADDANANPTNGTTPSSYPDMVNVGMDRDWRETTSSLPIELISFEATKLETEVLLTWITATEINNDYFLVQRSLDGNHFETIDRVEGAGNSNVELHYQSIDQNYSIGFNYYRLVQFDFDGHSSLSNIEVVNFDGENTLKVYPNPSEGEFSIINSESAEITIFTANGEFVYQKNIEKDELYLIDLKNQSRGVYFLYTKSDNGVVVKKLIIK